MTDSLQHALNLAMQLSPEKQDILANWLLNQLNSKPIVDDPIRNAKGRLKNFTGPPEELDVGGGEPRDSEHP